MKWGLPSDAHCGLWALLLQPHARCGATHKAVVGQVMLLPLP